MFRMERQRKQGVRSLGSPLRPPRTSLCMAECPDLDCVFCHVRRTTIERTGINLWREGMFRASPEEGQVRLRGVVCTRDVVVA